MLSSLAAGGLLNVIGLVVVRPTLERYLPPGSLGLKSWLGGWPAPNWWVCAD